MFIFPPQKSCELLVTYLGINWLPRWNFRKGWSGGKRGPTGYHLSRKSFHFLLVKRFQLFSSSAIWSKWFKFRDPTWFHSGKGHQQPPKRTLIIIPKKVSSSRIARMLNCKVTPRRDWSRTLGPSQKDCPPDVMVALGYIWVIYNSF